MSGWGGRKIPKLRAAVVAKYGSDCWICGKPIAGQVSLDHVIPRSRGGTDDLDNLRPSCLGCNVARGNRQRARRTLAPLKTSRPW